MITLIDVPAALDMVVAVTGSRVKARFEVDQAFRNGQLTLALWVGERAERVPAVVYESTLWMDEDGVISRREQQVQRVEIGSVEEDAEGNQWIIPAAPTEAKVPEWLVLEEEVYALCEALGSGDRKPKVRPGRKVQFDYDDIAAELIRLIYEEGYPTDNDSKIADKLMEWGADEYETFPEHRTLREKIKRWLSRIKRTRPATPPRKTPKT